MSHTDRKLRAIAYAVTAFSGIALPIVWFGERTVNNTGLGERELRLLMTVVLIGIPGVLLTAARLEGWRQAESEARRERHPGKPWLWREDWASFAIRDEASFRRNWFWSAIVGLATLPVLAAAPNFVREPQPGPLVTLAVAGGVLTYMTYKGLRRLKYGTSLCRLEGIPILPGQAFRGAVETSVACPSPGGFRVELSYSVEYREHDSSRDTTVDVRKVIWKDEQIVHSTERGPHGVRVPFSWTLPVDPPRPRLPLPPGKEQWWLNVSAATPGIDYSATFELPVFPPDPDASSLPAESAARMINLLAKET